MKRLSILAAIVAAGAWLHTQPAAAQVASLQSKAFNRWKIQDSCTSQSIAKFPDHDLKAQQARDAYVDKCLADHNLPPLAHLAPGDPPPKK